MEEPHIRQETSRPITDAGSFVDPIIEQLEKSGHSGECSYPCPICAGVSLIKQMNPEVAEHLISAAREFLLAARAILDSVADGQSRKSPEAVERIPLD
jgi:hypothetical protein